MSRGQENEPVCEKTEDWDEDDVGKRIVKRVTPNGTYHNELVVHVFCSICAASFIGPSREAGGVLGGHEGRHAREFGQVMGRHDGRSESTNE